MSKKLWYVVSYDVRDSKRLRKVAKHLEGYGERLQYSVFRCRLTERDIERMRWELVKIMEKEDNLLVIGLCSRCGEKVAARHGADDWADQLPNFEIV
ncbi:MAG: CRISPR-associated endonuclease Cas2 [Chloroflexota bacterium]|nr:CRISPR-associated endonuclease Cas2 [Chloroflexota bacterium]